MPRLPAHKEVQVTSPGWKLPDEVSLEQLRRLGDRGHVRGKRVGEFTYLKSRNRTHVRGNRGRIGGASSHHLGLDLGTRDMLVADFEHHVDNAWV